MSSTSSGNTSFYTTKTSQTSDSSGQRGSAAAPKEKELAGGQSTPDLGESARGSGGTPAEMSRSGSQLCIPAAGPVSNEEGGNSETGSHAASSVAYNAGVGRGSESSSGEVEDNWDFWRRAQQDRGDGEDSGKHSQPWAKKFGS